jgi:chromosome segregation ATPase
MRRATSRFAGGFIATILLLSLAYLFGWTSPLQAGRIDLSRSVDVAATAQAIQARKRQVELEAALQAQRANGQAELARKQQILAESNLAAQSKLSQLESQLRDLQVEVAEAKRAVGRGQDEITQLQQAIDGDETGYRYELAELEAGLNLLRSELAETQAQLQAIQVELARRPPELNPLSVEVSQPQTGEDNDQAHNREDEPDRQPGGTDDDHDNDNDHDDDNDNQVGGNHDNENEEDDDHDEDNETEEDDDRESDSD